MVDFLLISYGHKIKAIELIYLLVLTSNKSIKRFLRYRVGKLTGQFLWDGGSSILQCDTRYTLTRTSSELADMWFLCFSLERQEEMRVVFGLPIVKNELEPSGKNNCFNSKTFLLLYRVSNQKWRLLQRNGHFSWDILQLVV